MDQPASGGSYCVLAREREGKWAPMGFCVTAGLDLVLLPPPEPVLRAGRPELRTGQLQPTLLL